MGDEPHRETGDEPHRPLSEDGPLSAGFEMRYETVPDDDFVVRYGDRRGHKGDKGEKGERGEQGASSTRLPVPQARAVIYMFILPILLSLVCLAGLVYYGHRLSGQQAAQQAARAAQQAAQRRAGELVERAICTDIGTMAAIRAPAGNPKSNPSRAYEQAEARAWSGLYISLDCRP